MLHPAARLASVSLLALLAACGRNDGDAATTAAPSGEAPAAAVATAQAEPGEDQTAAINQWFEEQWEEEVARSPMQQTFLGRKTNYGAWDNATEEYADEGYGLRLASLEEMRERFNRDNLDDNAKRSWDIYEYQIERETKGRPFRNHWYTFSQHYGPHSGVPSFLINQHQVASVEDAEAYISRLEGVSEYLGQHRANAEKEYGLGIHPPKWAYPAMATTARNVIAGAPFEEGDASAIYDDFIKKVDALDAGEDVKSDLRARGREAMLNSVKPAYEALIAMFERQGAEASNDDGAWKLPDGGAYYDYMLGFMTTTDMTAQEIHNLGLEEVSRIHGEMIAIKDSVGFDGSLQDFFEYMRNDPDGKFTYPNTDEGREQYLVAATAAIDEMRGRLDELFIRKPKADLIVKRVEPFREASAGKAFYQRPAPDGSRPGIYYANLQNTADMPTYQLEALAFHEGIPGHHMQIAISQELEGIPSFRKFGSVTAFSEGWGLYSEFIPKEMGFYSDPYSDFGRLAMELWRAARLVVDTGIHSKQWSRETAIEYLLQNTPNPEGDAVRAIERYVVMPGQATAYKIGMLKIQELRARAEEALGDDFDIRQFHDKVLENGPVPLAVLDRIIDDWIAEAKAG